MSGIGSPASGVRFGTVTSKVCCAEAPSGSRAVTVMVAVPWATASTVTTLPDTDTVATPVRDERAS